MPDYVPVAKLSDLISVRKLSVEVGDRYVVLVYLNSTVYCIDDVCTHDGGPLGEGEIEDECLVCPRHGGKFDIRTGAAVCMPATESTLIHEVRLEGEQISVRLRQ